MLNTKSEIQKCRISLHSAQINPILSQTVQQAGRIQVLQRMSFDHLCRVSFDDRFFLQNGLGNCPAHGFKIC